jgi:nucleotide-binding universal stress UspA family protein
MLLRRVLAATDFSPTADACVRWASRRLAPMEELILLHVLEKPVLPRFAARGEQAAADLAVLRGEASSKLASLALTLEGITVTPRIADGPAHSTICEIALESDTDLVVVGPHGDRHGASRWLGTTADRIVRATRVPVLVGVRGARLPRRIVAAVDDSDLTATVLSWGNRLAEHWDAELLVVHVLSNAVFSHMLSMAAATARDEAAAEFEVREELHAEAVRWLESAIRTGAPRERVDADVVHGNPAEEVLRSLRRWRGDLLVVGQHGAGRARAPLLGGTVRALLHGAACPVLVVTPAVDEIA